MQSFRFKMNIVIIIFHRAVSSIATDCMLKRSSGCCSLLHRPCPGLHHRQPSRGGAGILDLGVQFWRTSGDRSLQRGPGGDLGALPQKLKKHCKLYTFEKYFVCHVWCQSEHRLRFLQQKSVYKMYWSTNTLEFINQA